MWLSDVSVKRPTVAIVLSLLLCVFGYVSFTKLAVREMPDISNPVVTVSTSYDGASASIMESQITTVLEDQLSGSVGWMILPQYHVMAAHVLPSLLIWAMT